MMPRGARKTCHDILDGASEDMPVVGQACGEGRTVIEYILGAALTAPQLLLERVSLVPVLEDGFLLRRAMGRRVKDKVKLHSGERDADDPRPSAHGIRR
jgi:hypothetical protein